MKRIGAWLVSLAMVMTLFSVFSFPVGAHIEALNTYCIFRLIADDQLDPVFGKGRVNDCYYPRELDANSGEAVRTMPEIYVWGSCTITAQGAIGKVTPKAAASSPMFELDTMPRLDVVPDYRYRYFVIVLKSSKPMAGKTMNLVSLGNKYKKTFNVDFTGDWQKIVVDLYDTSNWSVKNGSVYDPLTTSPFEERYMSVGSGFRVDFPSFYSKEDTVENFSDYYLVDWFGFMIDKDEEILSGDLMRDYPYMKGYSDGTFQPSGTMTRAEACTIVARLCAGSDEAVPAAGEIRFADVTSNDWFGKYVAYLDSLGYLKSYEGSFLPNQNITRAEFVELVSYINVAPVTASVSGFSDVPADHPRFAAILAAANSGVVNGYEDGTFRPDNTITRAEVTKVVNYATGRVAYDDSVCVKDYVYFYDVDQSHWAYSNILEATVEHTFKKNKNNLEKWFNAYVYDNVDYEATKAMIAEVDVKAAALREEIRNSEAEYFAFGTTYYVSPDGDDNADGKTEATAWKTLTKVNGASLSEGDAVLFKRGGEWRGQLIARSGVSYSAYGTGPKPIINASSMNFAQATWKPTDVANVYECDYTFATDVGLLVFNGGEERAFKQYKGHLGFEGGIENLANDLDFLYDFSNQHVYLRSDKGDPSARFTDIEANEGHHAVRISGNYITIDNLNIKHAGYHGVGSGTTKGLYVTNCEFEWIGGSIHGNNPEGGTRYGNAVEIYGGCDDFVMDHNYVYQVYDAGLTHQHSAVGSNDVIMKDVKYTRNLIEYCVYSIEYFLGRPESDRATRYQENILIEDNIMRYAGFGFGIQRKDRSTPAHIKGWDHMNYMKEGSTFIIRNNIFDRSREMIIHCGAQKASFLPTFENNIYIQYDNFPSATFGRYGKVPTSLAIVTHAMRYVMATMGVENGAKFYYAPNDEISALPIR